jgi:perosamine synthetase
MFRRLPVLTPRAYREELGAVPGLELSPEAEWVRSAFWISCMVLPDGGEVERDSLMERLGDRGIETRPFFYPMHTLPPYSEAGRGQHFPVATALAERGVNLPSGAGLERDDVAYIGEVVRDELAARAG